MNMYKTKNLTVSNRLLLQIMHYNRMFAGVEWSGLLFYKMLDVDNYRAEFMLVLDADTKASTSFDLEGEDELNQKILTICTEMNLIKDYMVGVIHTHHTMDAFFSGTDEADFISRIQLTGSNLSLITNYAGKFVGKIGYNSRMSETTVEGIGVFGNYVIPARTSIVQHPLSIELEFKPNDTELVGETFANQAIQKRKEVKVSNPYMSTSYGANVSHPYKSAYGYPAPAVGTPTSYYSLYSVKLNDLNWFSTQGFKCLKNVKFTAELNKEFDNFDDCVGNATTILKLYITTENEVDVMDDMDKISHMNMNTNTLTGKDVLLDAYELVLFEHFKE